MPVHTRSRNGCFTCREDGYKCDEQKPFCGRCVRLKKHCKGYGTRLKWQAVQPQRHRTASGTKEKRLRSDDSYNSSNATRSNEQDRGRSPQDVDQSFQDRDQSSQDEDRKPINSKSQLLANPSYLPSELTLADQFLLHHWATSTVYVISMAPGMGRSNLILFHLTPMLCQSTALSSTVMSMAASHLAIVREDNSFQEMAAKHQRKAIRSLRELIQDPGLGSPELSLATILIMQISSRLFSTDTDDQPNVNHLAGASAVIKQKGGPAWWTQSSNAYFLLGVFFYLDVLSSVSKGLKPLLEFDPSILSVEGLPSMHMLTRDVLYLVGEISKLQDMKKSNHDMDASSWETELYTRGQVIEQALMTLESPIIDKDQDSSFFDLENTAQAYRHAAFIYLYRVWLNVGAPYPSTLEHVKKCLEYISLVPVTSDLVSAHVWPLFTAGCESIDNSHRDFVLNRLDLMFTNRQLPSLKRVKKNIEEVWRFKDMEQSLTGSQGMSKVDCITVISKNRGREADLA